MAVYDPERETAAAPETDPVATPDAGAEAAEPGGAPTMADLAARLRDLEVLVADAKSVPLSASIILPRSEVEQVVAGLRDALPAELRQARSVLQSRQEIVTRAESEARRLLGTAHEERQRLTETTAVVQAAQREADRILDDAHAEARALRLEADDYVDTKLATFEVVLHKTAQAVQRGRDQLSGRLADAPPPETELFADHDARSGAE